ETAKANNLNVFEYVMKSLELLSQPEADVDPLLPWQVAKD
ncbi:MAG: transposase domain-containing protein, partial [Candidatus Omnitrophica bacterium]